MRLTASVSVRDVRERLGVGEEEALRASDRRRRYLETYSRLVAPSRPTVRFAEDIHSATTTWPAADGRRSARDRRPSADTDTDTTRTGGADGPDGAPGTDRGDPVIRVTTRPLAQPVTDFRRPVYDLIVQEALVVHELGHVLYTETAPFEAAASELPRRDRRLFARVWNTLEDGAVETQLRDRYAVADELAVLNANLFASGSLGYPGADGATRVGLFRAVLCGLADMAVYDSGRFARLLGADDRLRLASLRDERVLADLVPAMRTVVEDVLGEPAPAERTRHVRAFWEELSTAMAGSTVSGASANALDDLIDADGTVSTTDTSRTPDAVVERLARAADDDRATVAGKPDDAAGEFADARTADALARDSTRRTVRRRTAAVTDAHTTPPAGDTEDEDTDDAAARGDAGDEPGAGDTAGAVAAARADSGRGPDAGAAAAATGPADEPGAGDAGDADAAATATGDAGDADGAGADAPPPGTADDAAGAASGGDACGPVQEGRLRERYREELRTEATEVDGGEARLAAVESYLAAIQASADGDGGPAMTVAERDRTAGYDRDRWADARRVARRLTREFRSRLLERRRDTVHRRQRSGAFDRGRLLSAARGRTDVFARTETGERRAYECTIVLDRSGSMADDGVEAVERAAAAVGLALEAVDVDVTVLDLHDSTVRLVKAAGENLAAARHALVTGAAGGGTPLSTALRVERARLQTATNPFVVVLTDGRPDDTEQYRAQLDAVTFPVLGVYLTDDAAVEAGVHEAEADYFHSVALVADHAALDRRLQDVIEGIVF